VWGFVEYDEGGVEFSPSWVDECLNEFAESDATVDDGALCDVVIEEPDAVEVGGLDVSYVVALVGGFGVYLLGRGFQLACVEEVL